MLSATDMANLRHAVSNAVRKEGKKVKNAILTVRHNGGKIHDKLEITGKTGRSRSEPENTPGSIKLQGHWNPPQFRNIWIIKNE
ncbi:MAG: hypothetical protein M2R45_01225 [Verrucomicrobia subdivision 3 bacterium]|nr:hypothetical protein [Limisphaerales bacterium]MCS1415223.1 hypothetical protein [Limisphaerales bacterium]